MTKMGVLTINLSPKVKQRLREVTLQYGFRTMNKCAAEIIRRGLFGDHQLEVEEVEL